MPTITSISRRKTFERLGLLSLVVIFLGAFAAPAMADVGRRDHEFTADSVVKPTGQKPQSMVGRQDGPHRRHEPGG